MLVKLIIRESLLPLYRATIVLDIIERGWGILEESTSAEGVPCMDTLPIVLIDILESLPSRIGPLAIRKRSDLVSFFFSFFLSSLNRSFYVDESRDGAPV